MRKNNRAARAARTVVQFFDVVCQMTAWNFQIRELKHVRFWGADDKRKWAVFPYNSSSHITFTMLSIFSRLWIISIKMWETLLSWHTECPLPVAVRVSQKTRVPKLPIKVLTTAWREHTTVNLSSSTFTSTALLPVHFQRALSTIKEARKKQ